MESPSPQFPYRKLTPVAVALAEIDWISLDQQHFPLKKATKSTERCLARFQLHRLKISVIFLSRKVNPRVY